MENPYSSGDQVRAFYKGVRDNLDTERDTTEVDAETLESELPQAEQKKWLDKVGELGLGEE